jgi:hypothetical protein
MRRLARLYGATLIVWALAGSASAQQPLDEFRLKAAFVYRFPQFVEWPAASWNRRTDVQICVLEPNPFGDLLAELARGEAMNGRPLVIRLVDVDDPLEDCHMLVAAGRASRYGAEVLKRLSSRPVLTVGDGDRFLEEGGIIALRLVDRRVRFEVHAGHAKRAGLQMSAQLLRLAAAVHGVGQ